MVKTHEVLWLEGQWQWSLAPSRADAAAFVVLCFETETGTGTAELRRRPCHGAAAVLVARRKHPECLPDGVSVLPILAEQFAASAGRRSILPTEYQSPTSDRRRVLVDVLPRASPHGGPPLHHHIPPLLLLLLLLVLLLRPYNHWRRSLINLGVHALGYLSPPLALLQSSFFRCVS